MASDATVLGLTIVSAHAEDCGAIFYDFTDCKCNVHVSGSLRCSRVRHFFLSYLGRMLLKVGMWLGNVAS